MLRSKSEILGLSQLTTEPYARGLTPRNITPSPGDPETTVTEVLETEQVKTKLLHKGQILLAVLNSNKS